MFGYSFEFDLSDLLNQIRKDTCPIIYKAATKYAELVGTDEAKEELQTNLAGIKFAAIKTAMSAQYSLSNNDERTKHAKEAQKILFYNDLSITDIIGISIAVGEFSSTMRKLEGAFLIVLGTYIHEIHEYIQARKMQEV